eukprot:EG_transcript_15303
MFSPCPPRADLVVLSVFWSGTASRIDDQRSQIAVFAKHTVAVDVTGVGNVGGVLEGVQSSPVQLKVGFDGCGVTNGLLGTLFAVGLDGQCQQVRQTVLQLIGRGRYVRLNCLGLSRGAVAGFLLAKLLADVPSDMFEMNLLAFDPVPGNSFVGRVLDGLSYSVVSQCLDLRRCTTLARVLALYPHEPLPAVVLHAPVVPVYSPATDVREMVTLGCHQGAVLFHRTLSLAQQMAFLQIRSFLISCGTDLSDALLAPTLVDVDTFLLGLADEALVEAPTSRDCHSLRRVRIVRQPAGQFLNAFHRQLAGHGEEKEEDAEGFVLQLLEEPSRCC